MTTPAASTDTGLGTAHVELRSVLRTALFQAPMPLFVTPDGVVPGATVWTGSRMWVQALRELGLGRDGLGLGMVAVRACAGVSLLQVVTALLFEGHGIELLPIGGRGAQGDGRGARGLSARATRPCLCIDPGADRHAARSGAVEAGRGGAAADDGIDPAVLQPRPAAPHGAVPAPYVLRPERGGTVPAGFTDRAELDHARRLVARDFVPVEGPRLASAATAGAALEIGELLALVRGGRTDAREEIVVRGLDASLEPRALVAAMTVKAMVVWERHCVGVASSDTPCADVG